MNCETVMVTGSRSLEEWDGIIREASGLRGAGARIDFLSARFLETSYEESTLGGASGTPERFVVNLQGVDCFTFLDYIEAMRRSSSFPEFIENLKRVRYRSGSVSFETRNHFFTDWREFNREHIEDVTEIIGGKRTMRTRKVLNEKAGGACLLPGIPPREREISYVPSESLDPKILDALKTGDYAGIYSDREGLDVSHVGIIIKEKDGIYLRHASSDPGKGKVIDDHLLVYLSDKPGLLILRPR